MNPVVPAPRKRNVIDAICRRARTAPVLWKLLMLLAERDRLVLIPDLLTAYRERLLDHLHVVRAEITTASPLPDDRAKAVERSLAETTGRQVSLGTRVDPAIIGGAVARVGGTVYDGSVAGQLQRMKERLNAGR
jgi:F-type H+-transporting ATPase subunit delta